MDMFYELDYMASGLKKHIVEDIIKEKLCSEVEEKYKVRPSEVKIAINVFLDPGGLMSTKTSPVSIIINNFEFKVKPEHIINSSYLWDKAKKVQLDHILAYEVYLDYHVVVVAEDTYNKVSKWLVGLYTQGLLAQEEVYESLSGCDNIILPKRKSIGDA
jgi:hypothetical protein